MIDLSALETHHIDHEHRTAYIKRAALAPLTLNHASEITPCTDRRSILTGALGSTEIDGETWHLRMAPSTMTDADFEEMLAKKAH